MANLMALVREMILANFNWKPLGDFLQEIEKKKNPNNDM